MITCDNINGVSDLTCQYTKTIGTSYSEEISQSMSIDVSIQEELQAQFFGLFSSTLGISATTGYDWGHVSSATMDEVHEYLVRRGLLIS